MGTRSVLGVVAREKLLIMAHIYQTKPLHVLGIQYLNSRRHDTTTWVYYGVHKRQLFVLFLSHFTKFHPNSVRLQI